MKGYLSHSRYGVDRKQLFVLGGIALALVVIIVLGVCLIRTGAKNRQYETAYRSAVAAYDAGVYDEALEKTKALLTTKRLSVSRQTDIYLLMADIYVAQDKPEAAIAILSDAYEVLGTAELNEALQRLQSEPTLLPVEQPSTVPAVKFGTVIVEVNAVSAVLSYLGLTDETLTPIAEITGLQTLNIAGNSITSLSPVGGLTELNYLSAADNQINDLSPLAGLTKLQTLYLDNDPVTDLSPLYGLSSLNLLSIKGVEISEEAMEELCRRLPNCTVYCDSVIQEEEKEITIGGKTVSVDATELDLTGCGITDISELVKLKNLQTLNLQDNNISDLSPLASLSGLTKLILWNNSITNIYPLSGLTNLTYLDIDSNNISDLSPLAGLTGLRQLWCSGNDPASLEPIGRLTGLTNLGLKNDDLNDGDLEWLKTLTSLWDLRLDGNTELSASALNSLASALPGCSISRPEGVADTVTLGGVSYTTDTASIICTYAGVSDISGLRSLTALQNLNLSGNSITDISSLSGLTRLTSLDLSYNTGLSNLSPLSGLTGLTSLSLAGCSSVTEVSALYGLQNLLSLDVSGTGLTWEQTDMLRANLPACSVYSDASMPVETAEGDMGAEIY